MREYDAYLFDADGTLIDSKELIQQSFRHALEHMGVEHPGRSLIDGTIGLPMARQIRMVMGDGRDDAFYKESMRVYNEFMTEHYPDYLGAFPGVKDGLAALKERGKRLAVVTSRRRPGLERFLGHLDLLRFFELLVTPESTSSHKPDPEPALFASASLGVEPGGCVFIGDAVFDIQCGSAAGMDTALVRWGGMDPADWPVQPTWVAAEFHELLPE